MKKQSWVIGSTNPNTVQISDEKANNAWNKLDILYSSDLNGTLNKDSQQLKSVSDELTNFIESVGIEPSESDNTQLIQAINAVKSSSLQFQGYVSLTEPSVDTYSLIRGNMWINLDVMPTVFPVDVNIIKVWNGSAWVESESDYAPNEFHTFRNINDNEGYYWFGGQWKVMSTDLSTDFFHLNSVTGKWEIRQDVVITYKSLYEIEGYRKANTSYEVGDKVACPYHADFLLECITAGTTADTELDTSGDLTDGDQLTDGTVKWSVVKIGQDLSNELNLKADKSQFKVVDSLPSTPDGNVFYFIPE